MPNVTAFLRAARRSLMLRWAVVVAVMFGVITLLTEAVRIHGHAPLALRLLTAGDEHTIGTYYSAGVLFVAAVLALRWGRRDPPLSRDWTTLGALLALLAVDEVAALHERTAGPLIDAVGTVTGSDAFVTRVVAAAIVVGAGAVAALVLVRVFAPLPAPTRVGLLVALASSAVPPSASRSPSASSPSLPRTTRRCTQWRGWSASRNAWRSSARASRSSPWAGRRQSTHTLPMRPFGTLRESIESRRSSSVE